MQFLTYTTNDPGAFRNMIFRNLQDPIAGRWAVTQVQKSKSPGTMWFDSSLPFNVNINHNISDQQRQFNILKSKSKLASTWTS